MTVLAAQEQVTAWELRGAWAAGRTVVLTLEDGCVIPRVRGTVARVSPTGAFVLVDDGRGEPVHVPCALILSVRRPHFSEPADAAPHYPEPDDPMPGQMSFATFEDLL